MTTLHFAVFGCREITLINLIRLLGSLVVFKLFEKRRGRLALLTSKHSLWSDLTVRFKCDIYADCSQRRPVLKIFASQSPALEPGQGCGTPFLITES